MSNIVIMYRFIAGVKTLLSSCSAS